MTLFDSHLIKRLEAMIVFAFLIIAMQAPLFAQSEKTIFVFNGTTDGGDPGGRSWLRTAAERFTGQQWQRGSYSMGTVFKLSPPSATGAPWTESVLYSFQGGETDGATPFYVTPTFDNHGNLYGTTAYGGANGGGTVFRLTPPSEPDGSWTESVLFSFYGRPGMVLAGVTIDAAGAIYGPEANGVYQLLLSGGTWDYSSIYESEDYGDIPSTLTLSKGILYGALTSGGAYDAGLVFTLEKGSNGDWGADTIWSFSGTPRDGSVPESTITLTSGVVYGTTAYGGSGYGTVYSLSPPAAPGGAWTETILYEFTGGTNGAYPTGGVIFGSDGQLYGTTSAGGSVNLGTIFKLTPPAVNGNPWTYTLMHTFSGNNGDYGQPENTLLLRHGIFYGTTSGGTSNAGTVFELIQ